MNSILHGWGPPAQLGYVVPDVESAVGQWVEGMGVGPWYVLPDFRPDRATVRGMPSRQLVRLAIAYCGNLQFELCQPLDQEPGLWREFLERRPEGGLQHLAWFHEDYDRAITEAAGAGWVLAQEGLLGGERVSYYEAPVVTHPGTVVEVVDLTPRRRKLFEMVKAAAENWNGAEEPVHHL